MHVTIRRLGPDDVRVLDQVAEDVFDEAIQTAKAIDVLSDPAHIMVVALLGNEVIGQAVAIVHRHPDAPAELYIDNVGVSPVRQRQGVGRRLMDELLAIGKAEGCEGAWVAVDPANGPAIALYRATGARGETATLFSYDMD
jgi:ribosomal protein S18 acetylase RimI-like enzyme